MPCSSFLLDIFRNTTASTFLLLETTEGAAMTAERSYRTGLNHEPENQPKDGNNGLPSASATA